MCEVHPSFLVQSTPVARLVHECDECFRPIMRGEKHVATSGRWDGNVETYRAHVLCDLLAQRITVEGGCRMFGELIEAGSNNDLTPFQARVFEALTGRRVEADDDCGEDT